MVKGEFIFVYGTLRKGERMDLRNSRFGFEVDFIHNDRINGKMYHIGSFPGVKDVFSRFDPKAPTVTGEVFRIRGMSISAILDAYEGYNADYPLQGHYDRCQVHTERGRFVWVYTYNPLVMPDQLIEGGDWCRNRQTAASGRVMEA